MFFTDGFQFTIRLYAKRIFLSLCFLIEIIFWVRGGTEEGLPAFGVTEGGTPTPGPASSCVGREGPVQDPLSPPLGFLKAVWLPAADSK